MNLHGVAVTSTTHCVGAGLRARPWILMGFRGSPRVRVSGGDLCIRKYAEAPNEPAGENVRPLQFDVIYGRAWIFSENRHPFVCFADISPNRGIARPYIWHIAIGFVQICYTRRERPPRNARPSEKFDETAQARFTACTCFRSRGYGKAQTK